MLSKNGRDNSSICPKTGKHPGRNSKHRWLNDGSGNFSTDSDPGHNLGSSNSLGAVLGNLDGDGDLDAVIANFGGANKVWLNNGAGSEGTRCLKQVQNISIYFLI